MREGADSAEALGPDSFGDLIVHIDIFYRDFACHEEGFVVLLKRAPFGCSGNIEVTIIVNSDAHFRAISKLSQ